MPQPVLPFVLSYPRSGMHWLRHCVERMSGKRTQGIDLGLVDSTEIAYCRLHYIDKGIDKVNPRGATFDRVCLLLRDYGENYVRTPRWTWTSLRNRRFRAYGENIQFFEQYSGPKMVIYFEQHVRGFEESMRFMDWADIPYQPLDPSQYEAAVEMSKQRYRVDKRRYYRRTPDREITNEARLVSKQLLLNVMGQELFTKYLAHYDEKMASLRSAA